MKNSIGHHLILIFIIVSFISCQKHDDEIIGLKGTWIGTYDNNDTIIFNSNSTRGSFGFNRGNETRNGYIIPRQGSGHYSYEILKDKINVVWTVSSSSYETAVRSVYFKFKESEKIFQIGIFAEGFVTDLYIVEFKRID